MTDTATPHHSTSNHGAPSHVAPHQRTPQHGAPDRGGPEHSAIRGGSPRRRFVIVVRADPVICGHSGEARNLAEVALTRGFDDVRILTWPIPTLHAAGLPLKPLDAVLPYSPGITVERPEPIGDYKVPDGRVTAGLTGRLVELFTDGVPTTAMSLYLMPHALCVTEAKRTAEAMGRGGNVRTIAEAVGSDITNVVSSCVAEGRLGAAAHLFTSYLSHDEPVAVSAFTKELIVDAATQVDDALGTGFAHSCERRIRVSYPAIDRTAFTSVTTDEVARVTQRRGLRPDSYVLFLSRLTPAKGVDDLINAYALSDAHRRVDLVIAGAGPARDVLRAQAKASGLGPRIAFLDDVDDDEKRGLMAGCAAYALPSKPRPDFVETFGIALVEKMLAGGGPVITTPTGGIPEAVGDAAIMVPPGAPPQLARALDHVVLEMTAAERAEAAVQARNHAMQFDRTAIFDRLVEPVPTAA